NAGVGASGANPPLAARAVTGSPNPRENLFLYASLQHPAPFCAISNEGTAMTRDTEHLLNQAADGDDAARDQLLERHRRRLRRVVAVRSARRLAARVDPSEVVREPLAEAAAQLDRSLQERPLPFSPWLRRLAQRRLIDLHRRHVQARRRTVTQEVAAGGLPGRSALALAERLFGRPSSPRARLHPQERRGPGPAAPA